VDTIEPSQVAAATSLTRTEWLGVFGFGISLLLAIGKAIEIFHDRRDRARDLRAKANDAWFETIVFSAALPALRTFAKESQGTLAAAHSGGGASPRPHTSALVKYLVATEALKRDLIPIGDLDAKAYDVITRKIEDLDDLVSPFCAHADDAKFDKVVLDAEWKTLLRKFESFYSECIQVLRLLHGSLLKGEK
jgi:hypothetical protein